ADLKRTADLMEILDQFREFDKRDVVQRNWPNGKAQALSELDRWNQFFYQHAGPAQQAWNEHRYEPVMRAIRPALDVYARLRRERSGLNYQDLLIKSVELLRDKPQVRRY